jgi:hypothetical protein
MQYEKKLIRENRDEVIIIIRLIITQFASDQPADKFFRYAHDILEKKAGQKQRRNMTACTPEEIQEAKTEFYSILKP